jgi:F-type H+-transporting ATPase subunit gamma
MKELRDRIGSVKNTKKITEARKLVAAAKVRRAQEAVVGARPFSENLVRVLYGVNTRLKAEDVDVPLTAVRPVKKVAIVAIAGDRGLCGGFNNNALKKVVERCDELKALGVEFTLVTVGKKAGNFFKRREYPISKEVIAGQNPTTKEAQSIADEIFAQFVSEEVDKVEIVYTKFISLIASKPVVQTLLPLTPKGEICDLDGNCVDAAEDEIFFLTSKDGELTVETKTVETDTTFEANLTFEQDPVQILDALLPLYMNSQLLRALQESVASELAARMNAMSNASDNAKELAKTLDMSLNRKRQAKITQELSELVGGAAAVSG